MLARTGVFRATVEGTAGFAYAARANGRAALLVSTVTAMAGPCRRKTLLTALDELAGSVE